MADFAGFQLLGRFERERNEIHNQGVRNAEEVKNLVTVMSAVQKKYHKMENSYTRFHQELQTLPTMIESVEKITVTLGRLQGHFNDLEDILSLLESVCEEEERVEKILKKNEEVHALKLARQKELEDLKVSLAKEHSMLLEKMDKTRRERKARTGKELQDALWNTEPPNPTDVNTVPEVSDT